MTVLILLNIILMIFFALLGLSGNRGQWLTIRVLETQAIQDPSTRGPLVEQILNNVQPLLEQENDPEQRSNVIYL
jgi:hypothetical protein